MLARDLLSLRRGVAENPIFIALEEKSNEVLECFKNESVISKINFQYHNNKNEKFLYYSIYYDNMDFAHFLVQNNCSIFEPNGFLNNLNNTPLNLLIQKKFIHLILVF